MRYLARLLAAMALVLGFASAASADIFEIGKNRAGSDYSSLPGVANPLQCANTCSAQAQCKSWTWVKPNVQGPQPICYLKNASPPPVAAACCTSGVKIAGTVPPGAGVGKNRPGSDLSSVNLATPNPQVCANNCAGNAACRAWTYVSPGVQGPAARCYLKGSVPAEIADSCCISGVSLPPPPPPIPPGAVANKDRPGNDFAVTNIAADPNLCYNACQANGACAAWSYVKPGVQGPSARCYLKAPIPAAVNNNCCISGVKAAPPPALPPGAMANTNRPGNDFQATNIGSNPQLCYNACQADGTCAAWTYVKPGVQGPSAKCYLKAPAPAAAASNCCISGIKPVAPLPPGAVANKNRPGNDYSVTDVGSNPQLCFNACQADGACAAWSYVKPGVQGPSAKCYLKAPVPASVSDACCISGVKSGPPPPALPPGAQANTNRPGSDFQTMNLASADPQLCYNACQASGSCAAWSYVKPGVQGPSAKCYLKNPTPAAVASSCCVSGVKAVAPPPPSPGPGGVIELNVNRPGGDYVDFSTGGAQTALLCLAACATQSQCKAWTFIKPGVQGPTSHCWLKTYAPPPIIDNCCTSGVKP